MRAARMMAVLAMAVAVSPALPAAGAPPVYDDYRAVLTGFVDADGLVDYAGLRDRRADLDDFVVYLERLDPKIYEAWPRPDQIAFWINAYNALTLRAIIDHYPINPSRPNRSYPHNSIRQIPGVWDRMRVNVMGESITLQHIENHHLGGFDEPRIHVALVCAAASCPKLRTEPFDGEHLDVQLDHQARAFLSDPRHFLMDAAHGTVRVSEIFRWYADDFAKSAATGDRGTRERRALEAFAAPYLGESERTFLATARIEYAPYDWTLNEQPR